MHISDTDLKNRIRIMFASVNASLLRYTVSFDLEITGGKARFPGSPLSFTPVSSLAQKVHESGIRDRVNESFSVYLLALP
jgi:hypothetical protein